MTYTLDAPPVTYTLTVVNGTGGGSYAAGTAVTVAAVVPDGKVFDKWTGDTGYLANPAASATTATMPAANITVTATFKDAPPATYTLTVVNGTGGGSYAAGTAVTVAAAVPDGKVFDKWTGDTGYLADAVEATTIATMPAANIAVTANFKDAPPDTFALTVVSGAGGGAYAAGTAVPITAIAPVGKVFDTWTGDIGYLADAAASATLATMPAANITVTAIFKDAPAGAYTLTIVNGVGGGAYFPGTAVAVSAIAPAGKVFDRWAGDTGYLADAAASTTIATMPAANITVTPIFQDAPAGTYTLTVVSGTGGGAYATGEVSRRRVGDTSYLTAAPGTSVAITAIVPAGKVFDRWAGDIGFLNDAAAGTIATMPTANIAITAVFKDAPAGTNTLTIINGMGGGSYIPGTTVAVTAVAPAGKIFDTWAGDVGCLANAAVSNTLATMPAANITVIAILKDAPAGTYALTVINGAGGGSYMPGTAVAVTAAPPAGKVFDTWAGDIGYLANPAEASTLATMPAAAVTVTAVFKDAPPGTYTLTVVNGAGGGSYTYRAAVPVTAIVPDGKVFDAWGGDIGCLTDASSAATIIIMPAANITVSATYKEGASCEVKLASNPEGAGELTVSPAQIYAGRTVSLTAKPSDDAKYVFVRWETSGLATLDRPYLDETSALIEGDATLTALFAVSSPIRKAAVRLDNSKPNIEMVSVSNSMLPMAGGPPFTFDITKDTLTALVDGIAFEMSPDTGVFKQKGARKVYTFDAKAWMEPNTRLTLDLEKGFWSFSVTTANNMSNAIDITDGLGLFLVVSKQDDAAGVFRAYGENLAMTDSTSWKYVAWYNGWTPSDSGLTVANANGRHLSDKANKDQFKANGAFAPGSGFEFDPARDTVTFSIDGVWSQTFVDFDAAAFEGKRLIKSKAVNAADGSHAEILVNLGKGLWSFKMTDGDLASVTGFDGITLGLGVGAYSGSALVMPFQRSTLRYAAK